MNNERQRPTLLIVGNFLSASSGEKSVCEELSTWLLNAGWKVYITSAQKNRIFRILDMLLTIWIKRFDYHIAQVDVYSGSAFVWAEWSTTLLKTLGKPVVLNLHGGNLPVFARSNKRRVIRLFNMVDRVIAPSGYLQAEMQPYCSSIGLISNAVDLRQYSCRSRKVPAPNLIWLRAFHDIYNPMLIPDVLSFLVKDFPKIHIRMIGPAKDESFVKTKLRASELSVQDFIEIVGSVKKTFVPIEMNKGDIFLNTANIDNTPVSLLEAMACGLCIVSTNVGGIPYMLTDEQDALLVPPDNPEAMAVAVRRILTEPGLGEKLSLNARKKVEQFDWPVILTKWEYLIEQMLEIT